MTVIANRTRRLARSWAPDNQARRILLPAGCVLFALGAAKGRLATTALGAFLIGWAANPDPNRYYLEGFSDGLVAEPDVEAGPGRALRGLPEEPRNPEPRPAPRTGGQAWSDDRAGPEGAASIAAAIGIELEPGRARQPVDDAGNPLAGAIRREATGPRPSGFGATPGPIEPARVTGVEHTNGTATRNKAATRRRAPKGAPRGG